MIEPDPDNSKCLFVLDDDQKLLKIKDKKEGKALLEYTKDLSKFDLEENIAEVD